MIPVLYVGNYLDPEVTARLFGTYPSQQFRGEIETRKEKVFLTKMIGYVGFQTCYLFRLTSGHT